MRTSHLMAVGAAALMLAAPTPAHAAKRWFVELEGAPTADGTSPAALDARAPALRGRRADGRDRLPRALRLPHAVQRRLDHCRRGAVAEIRAPRRCRRRLSGRHAVARPDDRSVRARPRVRADDDRRDIAQSRLGFTGRGVHVAMHRLRDRLRPSRPRRLLRPRLPRDARATTSSATTTTRTRPTRTWQPVPHPDALPDDCNGHGTHVAGIVGANGARHAASAPDVTFGAYRVFGCNGARPRT